MEPIRPHQNKMYGTDDINGAKVAAGQTHEHVFYDSLKNDQSLRKNACEQARALNQVLPDYPTGLQFVCSRINIINGADLPAPGDQGSLL